MAKRKSSNGRGCVYKKHGRGPWIIRWYDHNDKRRERSARTTDRATADRLLSKYLSDAALRRDGVVDARADQFIVANQKPLAEHIGDYLEHCRNIGIVPASVQEKTRHLNRMLDGTGATRLSEMTADALERYMRRMIDDGLSARSANFVRQDSIAFMSWCVKVGRIESNPLKVVSKLDERRDRRWVRRPMTDEELGRLLDVAET